MLPFLLGLALAADTILVTPGWLAERAGDPKVVIVHADRRPAAYDSAHIAGARFVALGEYAVDRDGLPTELPPVSTLDSLVERLGIGDRSTVIVYGDPLAASRFFFTLEYLGAGARARILNGGLAAWRAGGRPVTTERPAAGTGSFTPRPRADLVVDGEWVRRHLRDDRVVVLDARRPDEYAGTAAEEGVDRPGHLPGARNVDWTTTQAAGAFLEPAELRRLLEAAGAGPGRTVVTYCRVGTRASALYTAARIAGYEVKLYDGSLVDWSRRPDFPIVTGPTADGRP